MMVSLLSPDPDDEFRIVATALLALTPSQSNPAGHQHAGYALSELNDVLVATSPSGQILAALAYHHRPDGIHVRMLGSTGLVRGAGSVLLCALAAETAPNVFHVTASREVQAYYARLGWLPSPELSCNWFWAPESVAMAARLFQSSPLRLTWSDLPPAAYSLVAWPEVAL
jgi:hypothetical protein